MKKTVLIPVKSSVLDKHHRCFMQAENMDLLTDDIQVRSITITIAIVEYHYYYC